MTTALEKHDYSQALREFLCDDSLAVLARSVLRVGRERGWEFGDSTSPARVVFNFLTYLAEVCALRILHAALELPGAGIF